MGEGKDTVKTEEYFKWLNKEPMLAVFQWTHPQPKVLPNGDAQFLIEGFPLGTQVEEEGVANANINAP